MKSNFIPTLVAGAIGAALTVLLITLFDSANPKPGTYLLFGFLTGAGVQTGVRLFGVS
jgi:hypothetical protein